MPYISTPETAGHKRKREGKDAAGTKRPKSKDKVKKSTAEDGDPQAEILLLENQILESRRHYNNIAALISKLKQEDGGDETIILTAVALCRVFCRLMAAGNMVQSTGTPESEIIIIQWLKERYQEYTDALMEFLSSDKEVKQSTALTLAMRLVKEEAGQFKRQGEYNWKRGMFAKLVRALLAAANADATREEFVERFVEEYDDIRFYTFQIIAAYLAETPEENAETILANSISVLTAVEGMPESKDDLEDFYADTPEDKKHNLYSLTAHKKQAQSAWLAVLRSGLTKEQRKAVLGIMTQRIAPWLIKPEMLMDFLTDSYNVGGATSLLALSGLFYLIQEKNLDYPSFYQKLYSLLDDNLLHSKHRSRFFRLLDTFMASTHLPAQLVASFIKRLSRLALHAPPAGVVIVVPWIYNMFKRHPTCTFMMHRETRDAELRREQEEEGMDDPFDMNEQDPMETGAIDSSIWEIETLQSHYHPNVATLAKIISEQFTKRSYNLEDFLDHSYNQLIEGELARELKKTPVVEYEIPKRIFTSNELKLGPLGSLMSKVLESA